MALPQGAYNHKDHEAEILKRWLESAAYKPKAAQTQNIASLHPENWTLICPPPNAYGRPHVGNISGYAYIDAIARIQRMKGKNVLVVPGKDHAGLEGEGVFVREVLEKQGRKKFDMKREDFYAEMMEFFRNNMKQAREDEQNIGLSADFDLDTFTLDPDIVDTVLDTFIEMYQKGMIYKGVRIVNWDPKARTAVADNQVIYEDAVTPFYYFKYSFGDPDPKALELKHQFEGKEIEWVFERNKTRDGKSDLPFACGTLNVETQINIEIIGVGYDTEINSGDKLKGKVIGILMRMNCPHRLVVVNDGIDAVEMQNPSTISGQVLASLQTQQIQKIFEFESKHYAGAHIILFDQYPEDKFYTNGFIIGTVRPETIFADTAIACNPNDERYKEFIGKQIEVEFLGIKKKLNFISDYSVLPDFGTGLLKITPAHANEDWEIAQRHPKECLPAIQVIGYDLKMNSLTGKYEGMKIKEAREAMEEDMIKHGNLIHVDRVYKNKVAIAERTKAPIEPLLSSQWYLSYDVPVGEEGKTLRQAALEMVNGMSNGFGVLGDGLEAEKHSVETQNLASPQQNHVSPQQQNNKIIIRKAEIDDAKEMFLIDVEGWMQNFIDEERGVTRDILISKYGKSIDNIEKFEEFKSMISSDNECFYVAIDGNQIVGWVNLENLKSDEIHWLNIYVNKDYQGKGIGRLLMERIISEFKHLEIHIATPEKANLKDFYRKFGFVEYPVVGRIEGQGNLYMLQMKREVETQNIASLQEEHAPLQQDHASSTGEIKILPQSMVGKFNNWMNNLRDWAISRSLWWGYRLPVWYHGEVKEEIGADGQVRELIKLSGGEEWIPLEYNNPNHILVQKQSPGGGWFQDENVLDTWFSSAQWPYATLMKYGLMQERYPTDVMFSGFDILENWDSRMMMFSYFKTGKVPFKTLYLTGLVKGTDGQKMSKSKGNVVSMDEIREKYGTDAVRMVYYYQNTAGADYAMTYEKLETFKRFANKIWNASKFVLMNVDENVDTKVNNLRVEDLKLKENIELFSFITQAKVHVTKNIDEYELGLATYNLYQYFWHDFADIHIEAVKKYVLTQRDKATNEVIQEPNAEEQAETTRVLLFTLKSFIKMLHPFMPFITQRIWNELPKEEGEHEFVMYSRW